MEMTNPDDALKPFLFATLARNALVIGMCVCAAWGAIALMQQIAPGATFIVGVVAVGVAADVLYIRQKNARLSVFSKEWLLLNASRWALIILVLKLVSYTSRNLGDVLSELPGWRIHPELFFWDVRFALSIAAVLAVWIVGRVLGDDLAQITEGEQTMLIDPQLGARTDRTQTRQSLAGHIFVIGAAIALAGSLANHTLHHAGEPAFPVGIDLVLYFALGLALLGLSQLTVLRASWLWERTPISGNLIARWTMTLMVFIGGLAILMILLPFEFAGDVLPMIANVFALLVAAAQALGYLVYGLLSLLLYPLAMLFNGLRPQSMPPMPVPVAPPPVQAQPQGVPLTLPPWFQLAQSLIFWAILFILMGYALRYVLLQHAGLRKALSELPLVVWLRAGWHGLRRLIRNAQVQLAMPRPPAQQQPEQPTIVDDEDLVRDPTQMPLREQVRLIYIDLLKRATQRGITRRDGQTPYEFAQTLSKAAPVAQAEIDELTQQFVVTRYSTRAVTAERVGWARRVANRIKQLL